MPIIIIMRREIALVLVFSIISLKALAGPRGMETLTEPKGIISNPNDKKSPGGPDFADPNSEIPIPTINTDDTVGLSNQSQRSKNIGHVSDQALQECDPATMTKFYYAIQSKLCQESQIASCPFNFGQFLREHLNVEVQFLNQVATGTLMQIPMYSEMKRNINSQNGNVLASIRKQIAESLTNMPESELKTSLKEALSEKSDTEFTKLLLQIAKTPDLPPDVIAAVNSVPKAVINGKLFLKLMGTTLAISALSTLSNALMVGQISLAPDNKSACHSDSESGKFMAMDDYCRPTFKLDEHVINFLALSHEQQIKKLNETPPLCEYYEKFNRLLRDSLPPLKSINHIQCNSDGVSYQAGKPAGYSVHLKLSDNGGFQGLDYASSSTPSAKNVGKFHVQFVDNGSSRVIDSVNFHALGSSKLIKWDYNRLLSGAAKGWWAKKGDYADENWRPTIVNVIGVNKLISGPIQTCCEIRDDSVRGKCLDAIENPSAKNIRDLIEQTQTMRKAGASSHSTQ